MVDGKLLACSRATIDLFFMPVSVDKRNDEYRKGLVGYLLMEAGNVTNRSEVDLQKSTHFVLWR